MSAAARHRFLVDLVPAAGFDREYEQWFGEHHIPEIEPLSGFVAGGLYRLSSEQARVVPEGAFTHVAVWEIDDIGQAIRSVDGISMKLFHTPTQRSRAFFYTSIGGTGGGSEAANLRIVRFSPAPDRSETEYERWFRDVHLPEVLALGGVGAGELYRLSEIQRNDPSSAPAYSVLYDITDVTTAIDAVRAAPPRTLGPPMDNALSLYYTRTPVEQ